MKRPVHSTLAVVTLLALGALGVTACGGADDTSTTTAATPAATDAAAATTTTADTAAGAPTASGAWARASAAGQQMGAMYMTITGGTEDDALVAVAVPAEIAGFTELHETVMAGGDGSGMETDGMDHGGGMDHGDGMDHGGGEMTMRQVQEIPVPAGEMVMLEPGGLHVMLMDLPGPLVSGTTFEATLTYANGATEVVQVEVRES